MVLVAFVLVLLAAVSFAVGIAASRTSDTLVYLSILFSLGAFVTLAIASFRARQAEREAPVEDWVATPARTPAPAPARTSTSVRTIDETEAHAGPLLGGLDPTQLDLSPSWRRKGDRLPGADPALDAVEDEALEEQLEHEEDEADFEVPLEPVAVNAPVDEFRWGVEDADEEPTAAYPVSRLDDYDDYDEVDEDDELDEDEDLEIPELEPELEPSGEGSFFDEYDDLTAAEILPFLRALDLEGLKWVRARERSGAKRATVVNQVEELIREQGGRSSTASTRKTTSAKKTTTKKTAAKKTAAKKTTAKKAAPARRTTKKSTRRR